MSTLSEGHEIEQQFYELKRQEWACSRLEAEHRVRDALIRSNLFEDVRQFHAKFGLTTYQWHAGQKPQMLDGPTSDFRIKFMQEELNEFGDALVEGDMAKAADALADLVYVALGTAHMMRVPFDAIWAEVQRANMAKVRATGADDPLSIRKNSLDVVKPPGWQPPDVAKVLREAGADL